MGVWSVGDCVINCRLMHKAATNIDIYATWPCSIDESIRPGFTIIMILSSVLCTQ